MTIAGKWLGPAFDYIGEHSSQKRASINLETSGLSCPLKNAFSLNYHIG
jgi:hypothetical protein